MRFAAVLSWRVALVRLAASYDFVREYAGPNAGEGVNAQQASTGNTAPDYWCMSFVYRCVRRMLGAVLLRTASCAEQRAYAKRKGALRTMDEFRRRVADAGPDAVLGWVFLLIDPKGAPLEVERAAGLAGHGHHVGLVGHVQSDDEILGALADGFLTTEGNAADPRKPSSRDGSGVYGGRLRGNRSAHAYGGREWQPDGSTYEFIDLEAL
jgi:hypothetical protein